VLIPQPILPVCYVSAHAIRNWEQCADADAVDDDPKSDGKMGGLNRSELARFPLHFQSDLESDGQESARGDGGDDNEIVQRQIKDGLIKRSRGSMDEACSGSLKPKVWQESFGLAGLLVFWIDESSQIRRT
jgi:hypothetical protein